MAFRQLSLALLLLASARPAHAAGCVEYGGAGVWLSAGLGVAAGATTSLTSAGIIAAADDRSDFSFAVGAGVGLGVTGGLSLIYAIIDSTNDCAMADEQGGLAWSVPITTGVVGALLPLAIWGAASQDATDFVPPTVDTSSVALTLRF